MTGTLTIGGQSWPLVPASLGALKAAADEPWKAAIAEFLGRWWDATDAVEVNTSGSTGVPRPILHTKAAMRQSAERTIAFFALAEGAHAGLAMPVHFIGGMMMLVRAEVGRWHLTAVPPASTPHYGRSDLDFVALTPPQAQAWQQAHPDEWGGCRTLLLGGGPVPVAWLNGLGKSPAIFEGFGMTETVSHFAVRQLHPEHQMHFQCLPGFAVAANAQGALLVTTPSGQTLTTRDAIEARGPQAFRWKGRLDDVVNSGGIKIHPAAVEAALSAIIEGPFACYGEPHERWGQSLVVRIHAEQAPSDAEAQTTALLDWAKSNLPAHHAPKRVEWRPLEKTWTGKWKRPRHETTD